jgi:hypothetical protein
MHREAVQALEASRLAGCERLLPGAPVEPPAPYPEEQHEKGEVSLMITKHCVRFSLSLCPKQAKGVTGVQDTVKAEPLQLISGKEKLILRFDCKPCEMHVVAKIKPAVLKAATDSPLTFYKKRPAATGVL